MMARSMMVACAKSTKETDGVSKQIGEVYRMEAQSNGRVLEAQSNGRVLEAQSNGRMLEAQSNGRVLEAPKEYQQTKFRGTKHQHERENA